MSSIDNHSTGLGATLSALVSTLLRFFVAVATVVFMLSVLFAGLLLGLVLMAVALLSGRRPAGLIWRGARWPQAWPGRVRPRSDAAGRGEVIDIEAHEVVRAERREG